MPQAKCFTFLASYRLQAAKVSGCVTVENQPAIIVDDQQLTPFLTFVSTNSDIGASESEGMLEGYFIELFDCLATDVETVDEYLHIDSTFILQFDDGDPVSLNGNEIVYVQEDDIYSYKVIPAFSRADCPMLSESVDIAFEGSITITEALQQMVRL